MGSGYNKDIGGPNGGDKTNDLIYDVEMSPSKSDRSSRHSMRESEDLIAMLTIAGLR
jgi:hypothetical protein